MASETRVQCEHGWRKEGEECWRCVRDTQAAQPDSAQEATFKTCDDDLTEEQITACRGILTYYLGGTQRDWTIGQHNEAGGYGIPLTPNEADYNGLPKNFVVDLILRTCKVFTHPPQPMMGAQGDGD